MTFSVTEPTALWIMMVVSVLRKAEYVAGSVVCVSKYIFVTAYDYK